MGRRFGESPEHAAQPKPNGHVSNGSVIVETQELQTLLPQLFETRLDAKGGTLNGGIPRTDFLVNGPIANGACGQPLLSDVSVDDKVFLDANNSNGGVD